MEKKGRGSGEGTDPKQPNEEAGGEREARKANRGQMLRKVGEQGQCDFKETKGVGEMKEFSAVSTTETEQDPVGPSQIHMLPNQTWVHLPTW